MRHNWEPEDLVASWTLLDADRELVANKAGATRLGFALLLSSSSARFPRDRELPATAVAFMAEQVGCPGRRSGRLRLGGALDQVPPCAGS
jgi:hypothetical protein